MLRPAKLAVLASAIALLVSRLAGAQLPVPSNELIVILAPQSLKSGEAAMGLSERARKQGIPVRTALPVTSARSARQAFGGEAWVLELDPGADAAFMAARLASEPDVLYAGPNHLVPVTATASDDSLFGIQYALESARVPEAWASTDGAGILIAIVDTGIELDHPDLEHQIAINSAEANGVPGVDDDQNGFTDDVRGYDFTDVPGYPGTGDYLDRDPLPEDDVGHGTQVAGVAAAERDNGIGIAGVAPGARVLPLRAGFATGLPFISALLQEDDAAAAILYAADRGAHVLNLSFGDVVDAPLIRHAVRYARERGVLVVASAGNTGRDHPFFPAAYPGVLVPGASTRDETRANFSTHGQDLDLLAPGVGVFTTHLHASYGSSTGTSFSAPMTAGVAALAWSAHPEWTADQVAWTLRHTARRAQSGWSPEIGWGVLDAGAAVQATDTPFVVQIESHPPDGLESGVRGSVLATDLMEWSLSALPESSAVTASGEGERAIVDASTLQVLHDSLGAFTAPAGEEGFWVFRLRARLRDRGWIEERSRAFLPATAVHAEELNMEVQAGSTGWGLAAWWASSERQQGAIRLTGPDVVERFAIEPTLGRRHGVRLQDPLSAGGRTLQILGRAGETLPFVELSTMQVTVPSLSREFAAKRIADLPAGTPMPKVLELGPVSEVFVETPPGPNSYGFVKQYEVSLGMAVERGSSESLYRGIPVDAQDTDQDGKLELIVFRLDAWEIWEASDPSGFPDVLVHEETGTRPVQFVEGGLLVVAGASLRFMRPDVSGAYILVSEAASGGTDLQAESAVGDFDADGRTEVACVNQTGNLMVFEFFGDDLAFERALSGPIPLEPALAAVPNGTRADVITVERDPLSPNVEGDLDRATTRVRRWYWNGTDYETRSTVSLAGLIPAGRTQLLVRDADVFLRRDRFIDHLDAEGDGLEWKGRLYDSTLPRVDGFALATPGSDTILWIGTSGGSVSEQLELESIDAMVGSPLRVVSGSEIPNGLDITLAWEPDACNSGLTLSRGSHVLEIVDHAARDTISLGGPVTYSLAAVGCATRHLTVMGRAIEPMTPRWEKSEIAIDLNVPLAEGPPPEVLLRIGNRLEPPRAVHITREGRQIIVAPGKEAPDSIVVVGAWQEDGLPLGGSARSAAPVPAFPGEVSPTVLADVVYDAATHTLTVTLGGDTLACDPTFLLLPEGRSFPETHRSGSFDLALGAALASGTHTLEFHAPCHEGEESARSFKVGRVMYPNPVRSGEDLVLEGLEAGSRIALVDVAGEERLAWHATGTVDTRSLGDLPPGLYFVRFETARGELAGIEKLAIIR